MIPQGLKASFQSVESDRKWTEAENSSRNSRRPEVTVTFGDESMAGWPDGLMLPTWGGTRTYSDQTRGERDLKPELALQSVSGNRSY